MIQYIKVSDLVPHPDNPRKDLGDLTELAESIKVNGVLQNLTVVPYIGEVTGVPMEGLYRVVIGHRRLAAAKLAGFTEVPCTIADIKPREQVATMLLENMQRSDLTVYEQAQGFQMMLDFGDSVNDIAVQTGFSESTVRRRVKLLELDQGKLRKSVERGATLQDYMELEKIKDIKLRNEVLDKIGTGNFTWELKSALSKQNRAENRAIIVAELEKFAVKIESSEASKYQHARYISLDSPDFEAPDDAGSKKYFYTDGPQSIYLYKERVGQEKPQKLPEEIEREKKVKDLKALFKQAYELRLAFAKGFRGTGKADNTVDKKAIEVLFVGRCLYDEDVFRALFDIKEKFRFAWQSKDNGETYEEALSRIMADNVNISKTTLLFWGAYCNLETPGATCLSWNGPVFSANERLKALYDYLMDLGYTMSDEEKSLLDGSHELYDEADPDDDDDEYDEYDDEAEGES